MYYALTIPEAKRVTDLTQVHVYSNSELPKLRLDGLLDVNFNPVEHSFSGISLVDVNDEIIERALGLNANAVVVRRDAATFYRVKEQKKAGREYPGIGVGIITPNPENENELLMTHRIGASNNDLNNYSPAGGTVELKQTLEQACIAETLQETGLIIKVDGFYRVDHDFIEEQHWISFAAKATVTGGKLENRESHKHDFVGYMPIDKILASPISKLTRVMIEHYMKQKPLQFITIPTNYELGF